MKNNIIYYYFLSLLFIACTKNDTSKILVDLSKHQNEIYLSDFIDSTKFLTLDMRDSCLISEIEHVYVDSNFIIIQDGGGNGIFIFDEQHRFRNRINNYGRGPGEYIRITNTSINLADHQIGIYDSTSEKIVIFSYTGDFIKEIPIEQDIIRDFAFTGNQQFIFMRPSFSSNKEKNGIWIVDSNAQFVKHLYHAKPKNKTEPFFSSNYRNSINNQEITFYDRLTDQFLQINQDTAICIYEFNLLDQMPQSLKNTPTFTINEYYIASCFYNMPKHLLVCYVSQKGYYWMLFNKITRTLKIAPKIVNDISKTKIESFPLFLNENILAFELPMEESDCNIRLELLYTKQ